MFDPAFAIGPSGDAVATWDDYHHLYAAVRPAGGSFGAAQTLQSSCVYALPHAAIDAVGDALVDWTYTDSACDSGIDPTLIKAAYSPAGGQFGPAETVAEMGAPGAGRRRGLQSLGRAHGRVSWEHDLAGFDRHRDRGQPRIGWQLGRRPAGHRPAGDQ